MKNWSTTKKVLVALLIVAIILMIYNWNYISNKLGFGATTRQYRMGGAMVGSVGSPIVPVGPTPAPVERPGSVLIDPKVVVNTAYHKCDAADVALATHGVHGECIGRNGQTIRY